MSTLQRTRRLISQHLEIAERDLVPASPLHDLGADSLAVLELLLAIEDEFDVRLPQALGRIATVGEVVALVDRELAKRRPVAA